MKSNSKNLSSSFSDYIRKMRLAKGYSQYEMASRLNISQNSYCCMENSKTKITIEHIDAIARILDISFEQFFNGYFNSNKIDR